MYARKLTHDHRGNPRPQMFKKKEERERKDQQTGIKLNRYRVSNTVEQMVASYRISLSSHLGLEEL